MQIPPGIRTVKRETPQGIVYEFSHVGLGLLGRLIVSGLPDNTSRVDIEIAPGSVTEPGWEERFEMLRTISRVVLKALGEKDDDLPGLDRAKLQSHLWHTFLNIGNSLDMEEFGQSLSEEEYSLLLTLIDEALKKPGRTMSDRYGIERRRVGLESVCEKRFG